MTAVLRTFVFAWQFLTAIPLSRSMHDAKPDELAASMSWYPLVGCLLGVILVARAPVLSRLGRPASLLRAAGLPGRPVPSRPRAGS